MPWSRIRGRGAYAPLSDRYFWDDAIGEAGEAAELLFIRGLAFCAGSRSDGFISARQAATVVGLGLDAVDQRVKDLLRVGLWISVEDERGVGYVIRSWLKWNRSREEIEDFAARDAARKRRPGDVQPDSGRKPSGIRPQSRAEQSRSEQSRVHPDSSSPGVDSQPDPPPPERRPVPAPPVVAKVRAELAARAADKKRAAQ